MIDGGRVPLGIGATTRHLASNYKRLARRGALAVIHQHKTREIGLYKALHFMNSAIIHQ